MSNPRNRALTDEQAAEIRQAYAVRLSNWSHAAVGRRYGVRAWCIKRLVEGRTYKEARYYGYSEKEGKAA